jgi:high-affinity iron transporter
LTFIRNAIGSGRDFVEERRSEPPHLAPSFAIMTAGLLSRSLAELQVVGVLNTLWYPVFDVGSFAPLAVDNLSGPFLSGLFGWDPAPSIEQLFVWVAYVAVVGALYFRSIGAPLVPRRLRARVGSPAPEASDA